MSDTDQETPDGGATREAPDAATATGPAPEGAAQPDTRDPERTDDEKRPFYRRPGPIVLIVVFLLLLAYILPPVVADEVPVGLTPEGEANAAQGGWTQEPKDGPISSLAGLVSVDPVTLMREPGGIRDGVYVYSTVKISLMLPKGLVTEQMEKNAIDQLAANGVQLEAESRDEQTYTGNGHDVTLVEYGGVTEVDGYFLNETRVDLFIASWRCSVLGSYAVVVGAVPVLGEVDNDGSDITIANDPFEPQSGSEDLQEIKDDLLANTKCDG